MDLSTIEGIYIDDLINVPLAKGTKGDKGEQGDIGIGIMYIEANEDKTITVHYTDETTQVIQIPNSIKGDKGDKPVKGVDYWTEDDKKELVGDILEEANTKITNLENTKADKKKVWNLTLDTNWNGKPVYAKTSDTTIDNNKTYYTTDGVTYTKVDKPTNDDISTYYEISDELAPYTKEKTVEGLKETETALLYPVYSDNLETRTTEKEEYSKLSIVSSSDDKLNITCDEDKPTVSLNVRLEVIF